MISTSVSRERKKPLAQSTDPGAQAVRYKHTSEGHAQTLSCMWEGLSLLLLLVLSLFVIDIICFKEVRERPKCRRLLNL